MKVLHITAGDLKGGASKMAYSLHKQLLTSGVESKLLVSADPGFREENLICLKDFHFSSLEQTFSRYADRIPLRFYSQRRGGFFSPGFFGLHLEKLPYFDWAEVIHLHWINDGFLRFSSLEKSKKPVVWTMHDQWAFTGGCHYSDNCTRYSEGCGACPILGSSSKSDLSEKLFLKKMRTFKLINFVPISENLKLQAGLSEIIPKDRIQKIYNGIDKSIFSNQGPATDLGEDLSDSTSVLLAGAHNLSDPRKGIALLLEALRQWPVDVTKPCLVFFGFKNESLQLSGWDIRQVGYIKSQAEMAALYRRANLFVSLASQEAFGLTVAESISCGTPVLVREGTGAVEILEKSKNAGFLSRSNAENVLDGILRGLRLKRQGNIELAAVFSIQECANQYKILYHSILR